MTDCNVSGVRIPHLMSAYTKCSPDCISIDDDLDYRPLTIVSLRLTIHCRLTAPLLLLDARELVVFPTSASLELV